MIAVLVDAGVVDGGGALIAAATRGNEKIVKLLLQQQKERGVVDGAAGVDTPDEYGAPALFPAVCYAARCSPRVVRLLVDAGADTTSAVRIAPTGGQVVIDTPLDIARFASA